jgi:hypothetical protein
MHSWMILSKRITENRRLETAAPAINTRIITRSNARVFGPEACLRKTFPSVAAIMVGGLKERRTLRKAASEALRSSMLTRSLDVRRNDSPGAKTHARATMFTRNVSILIRPVNKVNVLGVHVYDYNNATNIYGYLEL